MFSIKELFYKQYPSFREGQYPAIETLITELLEGDHPIIVLDAPTGSGKSAIIETAANYLVTNHHPYSCYISTATNQLQRQYLNIFYKSTKGIPSESALLMGRCKYDCGVFGYTSNEYYDNNFELDGTYPMPCCDAPCNNLDWQDKKEVAAFFDKTKHTRNEDCPHQIAKKELEKSDIGIMNYDLLFSSLFYAKGFPTREVVFFDEAHNLYDKLEDKLSFSLSDINKNMTVEVIKKGSGGLGQEEITVKPYDVKKEHSFDLKTEYVDDWITYFLLLIQDIDSIQSEYEGQMTQDSEDNLKKFKNKLMYFEDRLCNNPDNYIIDTQHPKEQKRKEGVPYVKITPLTLADDSQRLFEIGNKIVLASGTLTNLPTRMEMFGFDCDDVKVIKVPEIRDLRNNNPLMFNRMVDSFSSSNLKSNPMIWSKAANQCLDIMDYHSKECGIIHVTSESDKNSLLKYLHNDRVISYDKDDSEARDDAISDFKLSKNGVLIGFSVKEGIDFPDDYCRFQIITKVPYSVPTKLVNTLRKIPGQERYNMLWVDQLVQMLGRGCRSETDYCTNYILDRRAYSFYKNPTKFKKLFGEEVFNSFRLK